MPDTPPATPVARALLDQLDAVARRLPPPRVAALHVPRAAPDAPPRDAAFCAIELEDGSFGLSYVLLGDTLDALLRAHTSAGAPSLAGAGALALARRLDGGTAVERAVALAAANALTASAWRRLGYAPPPAGNSLGDVTLTATDHLGMIGFFPPLVERVQAAGGRLTVVELDAAMVARQRTRYPALDITLERAALAPCNRIVGTSTMLLNDTLDAMLAAAAAAQSFALIGPSAGLWPDALFARGVTLMGGTLVTDGPALRQAMQTGAPWSAASRKFAIDRAGWPGWERLLA